MKWFKNGVKFERGNYYPIIAKFDNSTVWFELASDTTQQTAKAMFKQLGERFGANSIVIKRKYDDNGEMTEKVVVEFLKRCDDTYVFRIEVEVPEGTKRQFINYKAEDVFMCYKTYKAEYEDDNIEVFQSCNDKNAFEEAESYESEHGTLFNLYEVDSVSYDEVRTVY